MNFEFKRLILPIFLLLLLVGIIFGVANYSSTTDVEEGALFEQISPSEDTKTDQPNYQISGKTTNRKNQVFVNSDKVKVGKNGDFTANVPLNDGDNEILIEVVSPKNKKEEKRIKISKTKTEIADETPEKAPESPEPEAPTEGEGGTGGETEENVAPQNGQLSETGPKENVAFAIAILIILTHFWLSSRKRLRQL